MKKTYKGIISFILSVVMIFSCLPYNHLNINAKALSVTSSEVVSYLNSLVGTNYANQFCLAFVADVWQHFGFTRSSACCAHKYASAHISSTSMSNIPIGADVFFYNTSNTKCDTCGSICGHIAIYIGDGYVVHASGGKVIKSKISSTDWLNNNFVGWGWHSNVSVSSHEPCTYRIEYNLNGGSFASALNSTKEWDSESMGHIIQQVNPTITCLNGSYGTSNYHYFYVQKPTKLGCIFNGWEITGMDNCTHRYWDTSLGKNIDFTSTTITANAFDYYNLRSSDGLVTFTAKWTPDYLPSKTFTYNGHIYEIYPQTVTWEEASTLCNTFGGHLATITTQNEQDAITSYFDSAMPDGLWIGLTDKEIEGTFKWVTGEAFSYSNWDTSGSVEPNNDGDEDYGMIYPYDIGTNVKGCWNDCGSSLIRGFICEYETASLKETASKQSVSGKTYYLVDKKMTWTAANEYAKTICGDRLATIKTSAETAEVNDLISKGSQSYYWIGLRRYNPDTHNISDVFSWSDGSVLSYTNFYVGEPNGGNYIEYFIEIDRSTQSWGDVKNMGRADVGNTLSYGFIVEKDDTYTITYNANGGSGAPASQTKTYGEDLTLSSTVPVKDKYTFVGWATSADAAQAEYAAGTTFTLNKDITLYAVWNLSHVHCYAETVTKKATCTTDGLKTFTCSCGDSYTETIKATGHKNTVRITEKKATCLEKGSEDEYCLDCSELVGTYEILALGHDNSGEWVIEKAATCTENGSKVLYCKRCTEKIDTASITVLGHNFVLAEKNEKHPHNELYKCTRCPETKTVDSVYSEICPECNFTSTVIDAQSCKITGYTGALSSLTVPAELGGKKVVSTATSALKANAKLTEVRFEDGITEIGSLTFMNCSSLKKAVVPASVTTIGTYAFYGCSADFAIYCFRDSYAHQYAVDNNIDFVLMDIAETKNSVIDYTHKLIFTQFTMAEDMSVLIGVPKNVVAIPLASVVNGNRETFGTGSTVTVFENNTFSGEYTVIVNGDLDGDGVSDVLDAALAERAASGHTNLSDAQAYAANNAADTEISIESYQNVVNRALGA